MARRLPRPRSSRAARARRGRARPGARRRHARRGHAHLPAQARLRALLGRRRAARAARRAGPVDRPRRPQDAQPVPRAAPRRELGRRQARCRLHLPDHGRGPARREVALAVQGLLAEPRAGPVQLPRLLPAQGRAAQRGGDPAQEPRPLDVPGRRRQGPAGRLEGRRAPLGRRTGLTIRGWPRRRAACRTPRAQGESRG